MLTSSISRRVIAPALAVALVAGGAPVAAAAPATPAKDTEAATDQGKQSSGSGSSEFTQDEIDNAKRFAGLLAGIIAIVATIGAAGVYFAGPHLGLNLPGLQK